MIAREVERSGEKELKKYKVLISFNVMMNQMWVNIWGFSKCTPGRKMKRREDRNDNRRAHDGLDETFLSVGGEAEAKYQSRFHKPCVWLTSLLGHLCKAKSDTTERIMLCEELEGQFIEAADREKNRLHFFRLRPRAVAYVLFFYIILISAPTLSAGI